MYDLGRLGSTGASLRRTSTRTAKPEQRKEADGKYIYKETYKDYQFKFLFKFTAPPPGPQVVRLPRGQGHRRHRGRQQQGQHQAQEQQQQQRRRGTTGRTQSTWHLHHRC